MSKRIYSPDGEPFDIASETRANDLVLNHGWSQSPLDPKAEPLISVTPPAPQPADTAEDEVEEVVVPRRGGRGRRAPSERWRSEPAERDAGGEVDEQPAD